MTVSKMRVVFEFDSRSALLLGGSLDRGTYGIRRAWFVAFMVLCVGAVATCPANAKAPNILLVLADDMGYGDLGCTGSHLLKTDRIDALAKSGVLCSRAYVASSVCSPSRAGLITGRDPRRFGYQANLNMGSANYGARENLLGLPPGEHTLADHLDAAGYSTALVGKWHLGMGDGFHPQERGFDY